MTWVLVVGSLWVLLAFAAAIVIGRGIRLAERTASEAMIVEVDRVLVDSGGRKTPVPNPSPRSR